MATTPDSGGSKDLTAQGERPCPKVSGSDCGLGALLQQMLEERGGDILPLERQTFYMEDARRRFMLLGAMNPFTVDPTRGIEAMKEIMDKVNTSGYW